MKRLVGAAVAVLLTGALLNAPDAGAVNTSTTSRLGYSLLSTKIVGDAPTGMKVYVNKDTKQHHASLIASYAKPAVAQMAALGVPITYAGYYTKAPTGTGVITISEDRANGCGAGNTKAESRSGYTDVKTVYLPKPMDKSLYVDHSYIYICPDVFKVSLPSNYKSLKPKAKKAVKAKATASTTHNTKATVVHELGIVGLGHTAYKFKGKYQVMYPQANKAAVSYGLGDQGGLKLLAAGSLTVKQAYPPILSSTDSSVDDDLLTMSGTAVLGYLPGVSVRVVLTVTPTGGLPVSAMFDTGPGGAFSLSVPKLIPADYTLVATSSLNPSAVTTKSWNIHFE